MTLSDVMLYIIKCAVTGEELSKTLFANFGFDDWNNLLEFSKQHNLAHIIGDVLIENGIIEDEKIKSLFYNQTLKALMHFGRCTEETERMKSAFTKADIPFVILKGTAINSIYPKPWYRSSADIDILIKSEDINRATLVLVEELKYENRETRSHDIQLYAPSGVYTELHFDLIEDRSTLNFDKVLSNVWNYTVNKDGSCYVLNDTMTVFYHIAHMAKHFASAGCGVRPFIDLYLMQSHFNPQKEELEKMLKECEILTFAKAALKLANVWFGTEQGDSLTEKTANYILNGGIFGNKTTSLIADQTKTGEKRNFIIARLFPLAESMKMNYPSLNKHPKLLPFYYLFRIVRLPFGGRFFMRLKEIKYNRSISDKQINDSIDMFNELGLKKTNNSQK